MKYSWRELLWIGYDTIRPRRRTAYDFGALAESLTEMYQRATDALPDEASPVWGFTDNQVHQGSMWDLEPMPHLSGQPGYDAQTVRFTAEEKAEPVYTRQREARPRDVFEREGYKAPPFSTVDRILDGLDDPPPRTVQPQWESAYFLARHYLPELCDGLTWTHEDGGQTVPVTESPRIRGASCDRVWIDEIGHLHLYDT